MHLTGRDTCGTATSASACDAWGEDPGQSLPGCPPDFADLAWLVEVVFQAEAEALNRPHIVIYLHSDTGVMTCTGPFPDALSALRAAQEQVSSGGQPPTQTIVVELLPPG